MIETPPATNSGTPGRHGAGTTRSALIGRWRRGRVVQIGLLIGYKPQAYTRSIGLMSTDELEGDVDRV
jgi:hypothetical protein